MSSSSNQPMVSVVIPAWNAAGYLPTTLESVFSQSWQPIEVIVVDDGSTDDTLPCLAGYKEQIVVLSQENSGGPSRPRNVGVKQAQGEFIAFFDSDDLMVPDKLSQSMAVFAAHPEVDLVCSNFCSIDEDGRILNEDYLAEYTEFREYLRESSIAGTGLLAGEDAFRALLRANFVGTSSVVCRRCIFEQVGPFAEEMKNADDIDMWLRIARCDHTFAFVDRVLHSYRITPGGVTARGGKRVPAMISGLANQLPYCRHEADRRFIHGRIRQLHAEQAWALRQDGDFRGASECYRASLSMGWSLVATVGLIKMRLLQSVGKSGRA